MMPDARGAPMPMVTAHTVLQHVGHPVVVAGKVVDNTGVGAIIELGDGKRVNVVRDAAASGLPDKVILTGRVQPDGSIREMKFLDGGDGLDVETWHKTVEVTARPEFKGMFQ